jgi:hypothetical protein
LEIFNARAFQPAYLLAQCCHHASQMSTFGRFCCKSPFALVIKIYYLGGGAGSWLPGIVVVALGEPGVPVVCCAIAGVPAAITAARKASPASIMILLIIMVRSFRSWRR